MRLPSWPALIFGLLVACAPEVPLDPTYENVANLFEASCDFSACHGGARGAGRLNFVAAREAGISYDRLLVGVPACEYDRMPLVVPYDPDGSWLMVKVAGPHMGQAVSFTPAGDWDHGLTPRADGRLPASTCPLTVMGALSFGLVMPYGSSNGLDAARADLVRRWILAGAPGPDGIGGPRDAGPGDAGTPRTDGSTDSGGSDVGAPDGSPPTDGAVDLDGAIDAAAALDGAMSIDAPTATDAGPTVDAPDDAP